MATFFLFFGAKVTSSLLSILGAPRRVSMQTRRRRRQNFSIKVFFKCNIDFLRRIQHCLTFSDIFIFIFIFGGKLYLVACCNFSPEYKNNKFQTVLDCTQKINNTLLKHFCKISTSSSSGLRYGVIPGQDRASLYTDIQIYITRLIEAPSSCSGSKAHVRRPPRPWMGVLEDCTLLLKSTTFVAQLVRAWVQ